MPDLSNLLGAVYGDGASSSDRDPQDEAHVEREPAASERGPKVPDWADDDRLDAAFAEWKPGPAADASPAEHAFVQDTDDPAPPLADDLAAALSEALVAASGTADDTEDPVGSAKTHFDFSAPVDGAGDPVPQPQNLSKSAFAPLEHTETEQSHELGEVSAEPEIQAVEPEAEPVAEAQAVEPEPEPEPVAVLAEPEEGEEEDQPEVNTWGAVTSQRAAAAELSAANRVEPDRAVAEPAPAPQPVAAASAPLTPSDAPKQPIAASPPEATITLPGTRRWDRSEDDILPEKPTKKFFSLSLRRG